MWSAKVVMALVTIIRKTGIKLSNRYNIIQVMLSYLYLEKGLCKYVLEEMEMFLRLVVCDCMCVCMCARVFVCILYACACVHLCVCLC